MPGEFPLCIQAAAVIQVAIVHEVHRKPGRGQRSGYRFPE